MKLSIPQQRVLLLALAHGGKLTAWNHHQSTIDSLRNKGLIAGRTNSCSLTTTGRNAAIQIRAEGIPEDLNFSEPQLQALRQAYLSSLGPDVLRGPIQDSKGSTWRALETRGLVTGRRPKLTDKGLKVAQQIFPAQEVYRFPDLEDGLYELARPLNNPAPYSGNSLWPHRETWKPGHFRVFSVYKRALDLPALRTPVLRNIQRVPAVGHCPFINVLDFTTDALFLALEPVEVDGFYEACERYEHQHTPWKAIVERLYNTNQIPWGGLFDELKATFENRFGSAEDGE